MFGERRHYFYGDQKIDEAWHLGMDWASVKRADINITKLHNLSLEDKLDLLDELGLALWFYDDGSLHKKNGFFNLNTHSFNEEIHQDVLKPYFEKLGLKPDIYKDKKKDGRE